METFILTGLLIVQRLFNLGEHPVIFQNKTSSAPFINKIYIMFLRTTHGPAFALTAAVLYCTNLIISLSERLYNVFQIYHKTL